MTIESTQAAPAAPAETPQAPTLTLNDLKVVLQVIQTASGRGTFKPEEFQVVGAVYDKLFKFLDAAGAINPPAPPEAAPAAPEAKAPAAKSPTKTSKTTKKVKKND